MRKIKQLVGNLIPYGKNFNSKRYWQKRYIQGGNSGAGSYGRLAEFKAKIINDFIQRNKINSVIEFGCGDGNQLSLLKIPTYIGLDVSNKSIELCDERFKLDKNKSFFLYDPQYFIDKTNTFNADLTLSLDVLYHLIEDRIFNKYMQDLFATSKKYVIIYASNTNKNKIIQAQHVKHRNFSEWVNKNLSGWKLIKKIENKYLLKSNEKEESFANFYIYKKKTLFKG